MGIRVDICPLGNMETKEAGQRSTRLVWSSLRGSECYKNLDAQVTAGADTLHHSPPPDLRQQ